MPIDSQSFVKTRISSGFVDWSGFPANGVLFSDLDAVEIARARNFLRQANPESELLKLTDESFLVALGVVKDGMVTNAGLILFGREEKIQFTCPQHQVHYVLQSSDVAVSRNDSYRSGLLKILERIEQHFMGPSNVERELQVGLFKIRIPSYPLEAVREAVLNAVTHRDYSNPGEILIRHGQSELIITSPGGFLAGINPGNILSVEPVSRNRVLAEIFQKLGLVERAGVGRRRIYITLLSFGKRAPVYETDGTRVTLRIYDGTYDAKMAALIAKWNKEGIEINLNGLLILSYLRKHAYIDPAKAAQLLQISRLDAVSALHQLTQSSTAILERRGKTKASTYHLAKPIAIDLVGKTAYSVGRGITPIRYEAMVREYVREHKIISPKQCRDLLMLGESNSARSEMSRLLRKWSARDGFLNRKGEHPKFTYSLRAT